MERPQALRLSSRVLVPPAALALPQYPRDYLNQPTGIWNARGNYWLCQRRSRYHYAAALGSWAVRSAQRSRGPPDIAGGRPIRDSVYYPKGYSSITGVGGICTYLGRCNPGHGAEKEWKQMVRKTATLASTS